MKNNNITQHEFDYYRIEQAIKYLEKNFKNQPSLEKMAKSANLSKYHFDRVFKRWAGISPVQFMHFLTLEYAKQQLQQSKNILNTSYDSGLSGPGRLHDLFVTFDAMTPGEYKKSGEGLRIEYGLHSTPFGNCLIAQTDKGICFLGFTADNSVKDTLNQLYQTWPKASFKEDQPNTKKLIDLIFGQKSGNKQIPFHLILKGTNFQVNVWRALLTIPEGTIMSYQDVADLIGRPNSVRAVANSIARNPISYLIPCHRVISKSGILQNYRWGSARKKAMLGWEASKLINNP